MEVHKPPLDWSAVDQRKEWCGGERKSIPQIKSNRAGVSNVQLFSISISSCLFHYLLSLLRERRQRQDLQPNIVIVQRTAEMEVPLASFITSRIVCISATLYGAVEALEVKESVSRQLIKS